MDIKVEIKRVLDANRDLTIGGIGTPYHESGKWTGRWTTSGPELEAAHRRFYEVDIDHMARIIEWLRPWSRTRHINRYGRGSYSFKHIVERDLGEYVGNGEFILAALVCGLDIERESPNAFFNLSRSGLQLCGHCGAPIVYEDYISDIDGHDHEALPGSLAKPGREPHWRHRRAISVRERIRRAIAEGNNDIRYD